MPSAIVIVGPETQEEEESCLPISGNSGAVSSGASPTEPGIPLSCVEVLGRSVLLRLIEQLQRAGVEMISLLGNVSSVSLSATSISMVELCSPEETWRGAAQHFFAGKESGTEMTLIVRAGAFADIDLPDAIQFHSNHRQAVTRVFEREGALDFWLLDPAGISEDMDLFTTLHSGENARYYARGYVNRLEHPGDLRRLVVDALTSRCSLRPQGTEIRPGIWVDEGAQVHRDARIVAPAYIGCGTRIGEQCLITRCSNVESNCHVDYGTVLEDSSILANTYVGIGLDLSHAIVNGNTLLNLERRVALEISDPSVIRPNRVPRPEKKISAPVVGLGGTHLSPIEEGLR